MKIETTGGVASEGDTFAKMIEHLRQAQECAYLIGHLRKSSGDKLNGQGWIAVGEMLKMTINNVIKLGTSKMRSSVGYRQ